jgi:hypothetical protein
MMKPKDISKPAKSNDAARREEAYKVANRRHPLPVSKAPKRRDMQPKPGREYETR